MTDKTLAEQMHDRDENQKIYEYFETVLKSTPEQADVASRTMRPYFKWSGVRLLYRSEGDAQPVIAVDHVDQVREFLERKHFDFLLPKPSVTAEGFEDTSIPGDVLNAALNGSKTAEGQICLLLGGDSADAAARTALLLKAERAKRDGTNGSDTGGHPHGQTQVERRTTSTNPFVNLRDKKTGQINPEQMKKVESFIRAAGTKAAASVARAAGLRLDGSEIPPEYL